MHDFHAKRLLPPPLSLFRDAKLQREATFTPPPHCFRGVRLSTQMSFSPPSSSLIPPLGAHESGIDLFEGPGQYQNLSEVI